MYETRGQDNTEILNCVREKLLSSVRENVSRLCERKNLSCVREKFLSCVRGETLKVCEKKL